jgi:hypothetical protein
MLTPFASVRTSGLVEISLGLYFPIVRKPDDLGRWTISEAWPSADRRLTYREARRRRISTRSFLGTGLT